MVLEAVLPVESIPHINTVDSSLFDFHDAMLVKFWSIQSMNCLNPKFSNGKKLKKKWYA